MAKKETDEVVPAVEEPSESSTWKDLTDPGSTLGFRDEEAAKDVSDPGTTLGIDPH